NARYVPDSVPLVAETLEESGYTTAAFVSGFPLSERFGLERGFGVYDDEMNQVGAERSARVTTDRAIDWLKASSSEPLFIWVHYFDPHHPYEPPMPYDDQYPENPYLGEVAAMDEQLGRLVSAFESQTEGRAAILVAGDHGESLGEHGEEQHGHLLYQGTMHVPLVVVGPDVSPLATDRPVSIRRVFHTILDLAGIGSDQSLLSNEEEIVLGEAMKPYLNYGWQPQVMAIEGSTKVIHDGKVLVFDVIEDPEEQNDLSGEAALSRELRQAVREYPVPSIAEATGPMEIDDEDRKQLASLGYVASDTRPVIRVDAPRPTEMTGLFPLLDRASDLFSRDDYRAAIPLLESILERDPENLMTALRLAAAHSALGNDDQAMAAFRRARAIAPDSPDVDHYLALHLLRRGDWQEALPLVEEVLDENPNRLPAIEAMAEIRARQGRIDQALSLWKRIDAERELSEGELLTVGRLAMETGDTQTAIRTFETLRGRTEEAFDHHLELGVLYLDARRFEDARRALERVSPTHPAYPMALFKRAQVSVLLEEPDADEWIARAREHADEVTGPLIERERLFR
ncbi:MAG: sulfatase-like hydrolase/transferase, partial [Thermoanaerobaculia bacterium]|nr:sulfatase-like hydrolase/transferase [Thermoanaerobaculia bacterium]